MRGSQGPHSIEARGKEIEWDWHKEGFRSKPRLVRASSGLRLFRAWGGVASKTGNPKRPGVCFSTQRPDTRIEAERLFSVWEYGNSCLRLTVFLVITGTYLYVGPVDHGSFVAPILRDPRQGVQVFVENPVHGKVLELHTTRLVDDLRANYVVPGSRRWH